MRGTNRWAGGENQKENKIVWKRKKSEITCCFETARWCGGRQQNIVASRKTMPWQSHLIERRASNRIERIATLEFNFSISLGSEPPSAAAGGGRRPSLDVNIIVLNLLQS